MRPQSPRGIILIYNDGSRQAVESVYVGVDHGGLHEWLITTHPTSTYKVDKILIEVLPPKAVLILEAAR